ncbi:MAG: hypothetical protein HOF84_06770, partial [Rhodospirillales bacterium]|nr:hypothetical protein [Rhodospirillales bacterium]
MASPVFTYSVEDEGVRLSLMQKSLLGKAHAIPIAEWLGVSRQLDGNSISKLIDLMDEEDVFSDEESVILSHMRVAEMDTGEASQFGLPPLPPFILELRSKGAIGREDFNIGTTWLGSTGQPITGLKRTGAILEQASHQYRIPKPLYSFISVLEEFNDSNFAGSAERLRAWADVQEKLKFDALENVTADGHLIGTRLVHASSFSLSLKSDDGGFDFDPILFGPSISKRPTGKADELDDITLEPVSEAAQLLPPNQQSFFAEKRFMESETCRDRYALDSGWHVILDEPVRQALDIVRRAKSGDQETKRAFARNPRAYIRAELGDDVDEGLLESIFVETSEYSQRVVDIGFWHAPIVPWVQRESDKWLPEKFGIKIGNQVIHLDEPEIAQLKSLVTDAIAKSTPTVEWKGESLPASKEVISALDDLFNEVSPLEKPEKEKEEEGEPAATDPVVLIIENNFEQVGQSLNLSRRNGGVENSLPHVVSTTLKAHQVEGLKWLQAAWRRGQSGVLLADDMGLGKTLTALSFLAWLREGIQANSIRRAPILIVAPTGLLKNWEQEHDHHLGWEGLGERLTAYGRDLRDLKLDKGNEITLGRSALRIEPLRESDWVLTTYETLRDYQHTFGSIRFAAIVFDEIQKIKTPGAIVTSAAKAMNGDFLIGLTGTPIENRLADLWCIVDTLDPGLLGDLKSFSTLYEKDENPDNLRQLKQILTNPDTDIEPVMLRRMKDDQLEGLPEKTNRIVDRPMPEPQKSAYSAAIIDAQNDNSRGSMLKALHQLKSVSLHPYHPDQGEYPAYISESARTEALFEILDDCKTRDEKALIFVEALDMHQPLAGFIQQRYGLSRQPLIISGEVTGPKRQARVNEFQGA